VTDKRRWKKAGNQDALKTEAFLRTLEPYCVNACAKFLLRKSSHDHVWNLLLPGGSVSAALIHSGRSLFPIFAGNGSIPIPRFMNRFLDRIPIHAIQGLFSDTEILEAVLSSLGYTAAECRSYDLMSLDKPLKTTGIDSGPQGLVFREAAFKDMESLYPLQAAYEQEEVLPVAALFNPVSCRLALRHILDREQVLIACIGDRVVGKINTNAVSFTRIQIGGVYVLPEYRGRGIARIMTAVFAGRLMAEGKKITLFVKKENSAAKAVYRKLGFTTLADYRITYY
jgi:ribosomal protein S18 acetylase RimI-like enzyme